MKTIKDIAKDLGISVSTVSRALNNHPDISVKTKERVLESVKRMNYTPNANARSLIKKKSNMVGLMLSDITDPFFSEVALGVEEVLSQDGYQVIYGNTLLDLKKEKQFLSSVLERKIDGLIMKPSKLDAELLEVIEHLEIPIVFLRKLRDYEQHLRISSIDVNHYQAAYHAVKHLIDLGHQQIGFIGITKNAYEGEERLKGYVDCLTDYGLDFSEANIVITGTRMDDGRAGAEQLFRQLPMLTAIFTANDQLAIGALDWLEENGYQVPRDVSVIGFENLEISGLYQINLTTVNLPRKKIGIKAANMLVNMLISKEIRKKEVEIDTQLILRKSSGKVTSKSR